MNDQESKRQEVAEQFFDELKDTFFFQIHRIQKAVFRQGNQLMHDHGIDIQVEQLPVLMTVHALKQSSQREIADIIHRDKSSVLRSLAVLQRKGLVNVDQDPTDKRKNLISLTVEGVALATRTKNMLRKAEEAAFAAFSEAERSAAIQSMSAIADKIELR